MARAREKPTPLKLMERMAYVNQGAKAFTLKDRKVEWGWKAQYVEEVQLERGFTAVISFEEQPCGLCKHLSIGLDDTTKLPHPEAVKMIAEEFGITAIITGYIEEYKPDRFAVNIVALDGG